MESIQIFDFNQQKKKKPREKKEAPPTEAAAEPQAQQSKPEPAKKPEEPISTFVDPYNYEQLLALIIGILKEKNPQLAEKTKFTMKPPEVVKLGGKRVAWVNFTQNCNSMRRPVEHVTHFFLTELGTDGSIASDQLILKGKYNSKNIESLIKKYIGEYVCCQLCKSPHTQMIKDSNTRLYMLKCENCQSTRSVTSIKAGFAAVRQGDRKKEKMK